MERSPLRSIMAAGNYVDAPGKLVALIGVRDLIVVDSPDALLVWPPPPSTASLGPRGSPGKSGRRVVALIHVPAQLLLVRCIIPRAWERVGSRCAALTTRYVPTILKPSGASSRKSARSEVASAASQRIAVAAIMQSVNDPRRLPFRLKRRAAIIESLGRNGTCSLRMSVANSTSSSSMGPQRNSVQLIALIPSDSPSRNQFRS